MSFPVYGFRREGDICELEFVRIYESPITHVRSSRDLHIIARQATCTLAQEVVSGIYLDRDHRIIGTIRLTQGNHERAQLCARLALAGAMKFVDVQYAIVAHNHLSGTAQPSAADQDAFGVLRSAFWCSGVELLDAVIAAPADFYSFRAHGQFVQPDMSTSRSSRTAPMGLGAHGMTAQGWPLTYITKSPGLAPGGDGADVLPAP